MDNLSAAYSKPNKLNEIEIIRSVSQKGQMKKVKPTKVDVLLESHDGELFLFDIKTAKLNKGGFQEFKRTLLEWIAVVFASNLNAKKKHANCNPIQSL